MRFGRVAVCGLAAVDPDQVVTSEALEDRLAPLYGRLGLVPGRLELMTGIRERRFWSEPMLPSTAAAQAGRAALERSDLDGEPVGALVFSSVCRDQLEPASANRVHAELGLPEACSVFDVSNACLGVLNGMLLVASAIELGQIRAGLVVAGEDGRPLVEQTIARLREDADATRRSIKADFASLTIGSGACAVVLRAIRGEGDPAPRLTGGVVGAATEHHALCVGGTAGRRDLAMHTDAEALLEAGLDAAERTHRRFVDEAFGPVDRVITHQVGRVHQKRLFDRLDLSLETAHSTFETHGNVGSVSLPLTWTRAVEKGFIVPGHRTGLFGIGSGINCAMLEIRWPPA